MFESELTKIRKHAEEKFPEESCGLIVDDIYLPMENQHEDPTNHFRIDTKEYLQHSPVQAVVHSHTNGKDYPSREDMLAQMRMAIPWGVLMCSIHMSYPIFWFGDQVPMPPIMGREFRHGVTDCYALVRDWYKIEKGIELPNLARSWEWWEEKEDILVQHFEEFGFIQIAVSELEYGDCVMGRIGSKQTNHCGIYVGNNEILHHLPNRPSRIDLLRPWTKIVTHYCRYAK